jgi:hypothetical protein
MFNSRRNTLTLMIGTAIQPNQMISLLKNSL